MLLRTLTPLGVGVHRGRYKTADYHQQTTSHHQRTGRASRRYRMVLAVPDMERAVAFRPGGTENVHRQGGHRGLHREAQDTPLGVTTPGGATPKNNRLSGL